MDDCRAAKAVLMKYLEEFSENIVLPRITAGDQEFKKLQNDCEEYSKLKCTCQKFLENGPRVIEGKTEIGQRIFMNIEVRDTKHVVVKLSDDVLVELNVQDAVKLCDRKLDYLKKTMEIVQKSINNSKTDLTLLLATMDIPNVESFKSSLPPDFPIKKEF